MSLPRALSSQQHPWTWHCSCLVPSSPQRTLAGACMIWHCVESETRQNTDLNELFVVKSSNWCLKIIHCPWRITNSFVFRWFCQTFIPQCILNDETLWSWIVYLINVFVVQMQLMVFVNVVIFPENLCHCSSSMVLLVHMNNSQRSSQKCYKLVKYKLFLSINSSVLDVKRMMKR